MGGDPCEPPFRSQNAHFVKGNHKEFHGHDNPHRLLITAPTCQRRARGGRAHLSAACHHGRGVPASLLLSLRRLPLGEDSTRELASLTFMAPRLLYDSMFKRREHIPECFGIKTRCSCCRSGALQMHHQSLVRLPGSCQNPVKTGGWRFCARLAYARRAHFYFSPVFSMQTEGSPET